MLAAELLPQPVARRPRRGNGVGRRHRIAARQLRQLPVLAGDVGSQPFQPPACLAEPGGGRIEPCGGLGGHGRQWQPAGGKAGRIAPPQGQRGERRHCGGLGGGKLACRAGQRGFQRPLGADGVDGAAQQRRRGRLGRRRQRLGGPAAPALPGGEVGRRRVRGGSQPGVLADQPLHGLPRGGRGQGGAHRLRRQRQPEPGDGVGHPRALRGGIGADAGQVVGGLLHHRPPLGERVDGVLGGEGGRVERQVGAFAPEPRTLGGLALGIPGRLAAGLIERPEAVGGVARQARRVGKSKKFLARLGKLPQQRGDAADAVEPVLLLVEGAQPLLPGGQLPGRLTPAPVGLLPGLRGQCPLADFALCGAPGLGGLGQPPPPAPIADQRFCLFPDALQRRPRVGHAERHDAAALPQQLHGPFTQARAVEAEAALEEVAADPAVEGAQRLVRHRLAGGVGQGAAAPLSPHKAARGAVPGGEREADAQPGQAVQETGNRCGGRSRTGRRRWRPARWTCRPRWRRGPPRAGPRRGSRA